MNHTASYGPKEPYSALAIANYFLDKGVMDGEPIDQLRLQKLVYLAHGWTLAVYDRPLLDEPVEAWRYGPVVPSLYKAFKRWGNDEILENAVSIRGTAISVPAIRRDDPETRSLLAKVWEIYKPYSGIQLSNMTHKPGTPWETTWKASRGSGAAVINNEVIQRHFKELMQKGRSSSN